MGVYGVARCPPRASPAAGTARRGSPGTGGPNSLPLARLMSRRRSTRPPRRLAHACKTLTCLEIAHAAAPFFGPFLALCDCRPLVQLPTSVDEYVDHSHRARDSARPTGGPRDAIRRL